MNQSRPALREATPVRALVWLFAAGCQWGDSAPPLDLQCGEIIRTNRYDCFVPVPAGDFVMGGQAEDPAGVGFDPEATPSEGPPHRVHVEGFWMMQREASSSLYRRCRQQGRCDPEHFDGAGVFSTFVEGRTKSQHAINGVDWYGATQLCSWLGGRLPTEREWEYAARGPDSRRFPWGDQPGCGYLDVSDAGPGGRINHAGDVEMARGTCTKTGVSAYTEVRGPSPFGVMGMGGNLWEWTSDDFTPYPGGDALPDHVNGRTLKVQRGGGWTSADPIELRAASRMPVEPDTGMMDVGVRCVWGRSL